MVRRFRSNRGISRILKNNTRIRERESEEARTTNVLGKDYDTERCLFGRNGYRDFSVYAHPGNFYWFSVRSDSQRSFHTPVSHPRLLTLTFPSSLSVPFSSFSFLLLPYAAVREFESFSLSVPQYLGRKGFLHNGTLIYRVSASFFLSLSITISLFISQLRRVQDHFETLTIKSFTMSVK